MDLINKLFNNAKKCMEHSYSPYSNYQVGAAILTNNNNIYTGTNIENVSYGLTICAESTAIAQMITAGENSIKAMLVIANHDRMCSPCGACRQRIAEFGSPDTKIHMCNAAEVLETTTLKDLLPYAFQDQNIKR